MSCKAKVVAMSPTDSGPLRPESGAQREAAARFLAPVSEEVSKDFAPKVPTSSGLKRKARPAADCSAPVDGCGTQISKKKPGRRARDAGDLAARASAPRDYGPVDADLDAGTRSSDTGTRSSDTVDNATVMATSFD